MNIQTLIPTKYLLNSPITAIGFDEQMFLLLKWAKTRESRMVCLANVHMLMEAYWNQEFASVLETADLVAPDGMPLVWMLRQMGMHNQDRVAGMDVFLRLCQLSSLSKVGVFFLGSHSAVLRQMKKRLVREFPHLKIAGMEPLPFRPLTQTEDKVLIQKINESDAGFLFVCLGCPKQEYWMARHLGKIQSVMLGIGAVFPIYAGIQKRAPRLIRESGLEWLYRLSQEPHRLWHRYSQTIPPFVWLAIKQLLAHPKDQPLHPLLEGNCSVANKRFFTELIFDLANVDLQPSKIGEILVRQNLISETFLTKALEEQCISHKKIGEILIEQGYISLPELEYYLKNQKIKIGEMLVQNNIISSVKLQQLLAEQKQTNKKLGEILIQKKLLSPKQLQQFLLEQYYRKQGFWLTSDVSDSELVILDNA